MPEVSVFVLVVLVSGVEPFAEERAASGIADGLIRFSVGIEGTADLVADLEAALASLVPVGKE